MRACKALVFILRQAASRRAVVVAFEHKIVAEKRTMARPRRIRQIHIEAVADTYKDLDGRHLSVSDKRVTLRYRLSGETPAGPDLVPPSTGLPSPALVHRPQDPLARESGQMSRFLPLFIRSKSNAQ